MAVAAVAFVLNLALASVLGISFWARDRGTRRLAARLAALRDDALRPASRHAIQTHPDGRPDGR